MLTELLYLLQLFEILVESFGSFRLLEELFAASSNNREAMIEQRLQFDVLVWVQWD